MSVSDCIFCQIVAGTAACQEIYRDEATLAFVDINPANDGHCLVIPKAHYPMVLDITPEAFAAAARTATRVARAVNAAVKPEGINLMQANGEGAGQSVGHFHLHIIPRRAEDMLLFNWEPKPGDQGRIGEVAERIRGLL
jgi:histidine triad (HIT) family protein